MIINQQKMALVTADLDQIGAVADVHQVIREDDLGVFTPQVTHSPWTKNHGKAIGKWENHRKTIEQP